ncbi:hypothetical protein ACWGOE_06510 [Leucobacter chromiiresistens]
MSTTDTQNIPSSVPNFLEDDEDEGGVVIQAGTVQQPENSAEPSRTVTESKPIGAVSDSESKPIGADSQTEAADYNAILAGDMDDFDDEEQVRTATDSPAAPTGKEWKARVAAGEVKGYEHPNKGRNPDSPYKKKGSTYRRKRLGEKDFTVLATLLIHEFLTTKMVAIIRGISVPSARRLMLGLQEIGVVGQEKFPYGPQLWYLRGKGLTYLKGAMEISEYAQPLHRKGHFDISKIRPNLLAAHVSAQLIAGKDTIRQFIDIPLSEGIDLIPHLIPESYIRSEFTKAIQKTAGKGVFGSKDRRVKAIRDHWNNIRSESSSDKEAQLKAHPEIWMTVGKFALHNSAVKQFHPADLIINLLPAGHLPVRIEIETSIKSEAEIRKIITTYMDADTPLVQGMVVYLTHEKAIATRVLEIAQEVYEEITQMKSKPKEQWHKQASIKVALLQDADGSKFSGNVWDL